MVFLIMAMIDLIEPLGIVIIWTTQVLYGPQTLGSKTMHIKTVKTIIFIVHYNKDNHMVIGFCWPTLIILLIEWKKWVDCLW